MTPNKKRERILDLVSSRIQVYPRVIRPQYAPSEGDWLLAVEHSLEEAKMSCIGIFPHGTFHTAFGPDIKSVQIAAYLRLVEDAVSLLVSAIPDDRAERIKTGDTEV